MWKCSFCGASIGLFAKHGKLKAGQRYLYVRKERDGLRKRVGVSRVGRDDAVTPGRLCPKCQANWEATQKAAAEEKERLDGRAGKRRRPERGVRPTVENRPWVLDSMSIASSETLARYATTTRQVSREEILALGRNESEFGIRGYKRGDEEAVFFASSRSRYYEWIIVRPGHNSWAIAHFERRQPDRSRQDDGSHSA